LARKRFVGIIFHIGGIAPFCSITLPRKFASIVICSVIHSWCFSHSLLTFRKIYKRFELIIAFIIDKKEFVKIRFNLELGSCFLIVPQRLDFLFGKTESAISGIAQRIWVERKLL